MEAVARLGRWYQKNVWKWTKEGKEWGEELFPGLQKLTADFLGAETKRRAISSNTVGEDIKWCSRYEKQCSGSSKS